MVDAGAVVDALGSAPDAANLRRLLAEQELHAPTLLDYEVVSIVRGLVVGRRLSLARATDLLNDFEALGVRRWPSVAPLRTRALELRDNLSAYDAAYVALAEVLGCPLVTRDHRLARTAGHQAAIDVY